MKFYYWINDASGWHKVTHEEYSAFDGEKEIRPSTWGMFLAQALLEKYRYM